MEQTARCRVYANFCGALFLGTMLDALYWPWWNHDFIVGFYAVFAVLSVPSFFRLTSTCKRPTEKALYRWGFLGVILYYLVLVVLQGTGTAGNIC